MAASSPLNLTRRHLLGIAGSTLALFGCSTVSKTGPQSSLSPRKSIAGIADDADYAFAGIPNFCAHEHWGSLNSLGMTDSAFNADYICGAIPQRRTGLTDVLFDPYFGMHLHFVGVDLNAYARKSGADSFEQLAARSPAEALFAIRPVLAQQELTGVYQCLRRGLLAIHGVDIHDLDAPGSAEAIGRLDARIATAYENLFAHYRTSMKHAGFSEVVFAVHPEYYAQEQSPALAMQARDLIHTVMRIDPLLELWETECPRRDRLAGIVGLEPHDPASWREFIGRIMDLAARNGALGIKQLQAYSRSLAFDSIEDGQVILRGDLDPQQRMRCQNWIVNECSRQAHERGWVHQIHVGTHNLTQSNPLPLEALARRYPAMKIVQLHCWPFLNEAGWLAKQLPNIYIDPCWQPVLSPAFLRESLSRWLNYVPLHKLMLSHDSTSVEMAAGSALFTREILAEQLVAQTGHLGVGETRLRAIAADLLQNNQVAVYGVGQRHES